MPTLNPNDPIVTLLTSRTYITGDDFADHTPVALELDSHGGVAHLNFDLTPALNSGQLDAYDFSNPEDIDNFKTHIEQWIKQELDELVPERVLAEVRADTAELNVSWRVTASRCGETVQDFWSEGVRDPAEVIISAFRNPRWPDNL